MLQEVLPTTAALLTRGIAQGLHPGAQLCVWQRGQCVVDAGLGDARPGVTLTASTLTLWLSAGKPLLAVALAQFVEAGQVDLDDPVAEYVPEFAARGKEHITLRHVLTHTGGFRSVVFRYPQQTWDEAVDAVCAARLETGWELGVTAGYHPHSGWNILGRVLEVCSGQTLGNHLRKAVLRPLGMNDSFVGMPEVEFDRRGTALAIAYDTSGSEARPLEMHTRPWVTGQRPGGNVYGPAHDLARFYQAMLGGGALDGVRVLKSDTVKQFTNRHRRDTMDRTFRAVMDWGLGFMVSNQRHDAVNAATHGGLTPYGFGPHASDAAFGHGGNQSSMGFADPEHDLAVALICTGLPGEPKHQQRMHSALGAIYEDLQLVD